MRKILFTLIALMCSVSMWGQTVKLGRFYYNFSGTNATITYGSSECTNFIAIPSTVTYNGKTYDVTSIGEYAFADCNLTSIITIPEDLTPLRHLSV